MQIKIIVLSCFLLVAVFAGAQDESVYKPFKVDVSVGVGIPEGSGTKVGGVFALEPKYAVLENLSVGLRLETAVFARARSTNADGTVADLEVKGAGSYLATGDYYFTAKHSFRPFAGAGVGIYSLASASSSYGTIEKGGTKFGGAVRGGFEAGHFRLGIEYNFVPATKGLSVDDNSNVIATTIRNNYWGFKVGVVFGGGKRG